MVRAGHWDRSWARAGLWAPLQPPGVVVTTCRNPRTQPQRVVVNTSTNRRPQPFGVVGVVTHNNLQKRETQPLSPHLSIRILPKLQVNTRSTYRLCVWSDICDENVWIYSLLWVICIHMSTMQHNGSNNRGNLRTQPHSPTTQCGL